MIDMIVTGLITGAMGYLFPQPKWAGVLQTMLWEFVKRKLAKKV